jgi:hypothetical protein
MHRVLDVTWTTLGILRVWVTDSGRMVSWIIRLPDFPGLQVTFGLLLTNSFRGIIGDILGAKTSEEGELEVDVEEESLVVVKAVLLFLDIGTSSHSCSIERTSSQLPEVVELFCNNTIE